MMDLANILALFQEGSQDSQGLLSQTSALLSQLGLGWGELTAGGATVGLAVVWYVARVIRAMVTVLIVLCLLLLVLQLAGVVDLAPLYEMLQGWCSAEPQQV